MFSIDPVKLSKRFFLRVWISKAESVTLFVLSAKNILYPLVSTIRASVPVTLFYPSWPAGTHVRPKDSNVPNM